jgi:hypothetical protein
VHHLPRSVATGRRETDQLLPFFVREIDVIAFHLYYLHDSSSIGTVFGLLAPMNTQRRRLDK